LRRARGASTVRVTMMGSHTPSLSTPRSPPPWTDNLPVRPSPAHYHGQREASYKRRAAE
jgi:hypothetical protein